MLNQYRLIPFYHQCKKIANESYLLLIFKTINEIPSSQTLSFLPVKSKRLDFLEQIKKKEKKRNEQKDN